MLILLRASRVVSLSCNVAICLACAGAGARAADDLSEASRKPYAFSPLTMKFEPTLRIGGYVGALSHQALASITFERPWRTRLQSDYIADIHAIYTVYRFESLPLELEIEGGIAKRFGQDHRTEFDLIPMARWKYWPWNDYIYTTFRLGLAGPSYVTGVSDWEKQNTGNHKGSRFLSFLIPEFTFAPSVDSPIEVFVRVHHRSGIFGLINGVHGGSNYVSAGLRFVAY